MTRQGTIVERILGRLGPPRILWVAAWTSLPLAQHLVLVAVLAVTGDLDRAPGIEHMAVTLLVESYAVLLAIVGVTLLARGASEAEGEISALDDGPSASFGAMSDGLPPVALTALIVVIASLDTQQRFGLASALAVAPLLAMTVLPLATLAWAFISVLRSLDRLGRRQLRIDPYPADRSLGLRAIGALAFTGFWLVIAIGAPILIAAGHDLATWSVSAGLLVACTALFFLSMWRLHGRMLEVKARHVSEARERYARAYAPLQISGSPETLRDQAPLLAAAEALERRAETIHEWPLDERTTRVIGVLLAGTASGLIVRLVFVVAGH